MSALGGLAARPAALLLALTVLAMHVSVDRAAAAAPPDTMRLIMVDEPSCRYCRKWDAEVGTSYTNSPEGRFAPLERVRRDAERLRPFAPVIYTPTFILARGDREVGRITGYPGQFYFWEELAPLLGQAGMSPRITQ